MFGETSIEKTELLQEKVSNVSVTGNRKSTERPTTSTNLHPWDSQSETPTEEHTQVRPRSPYAYGADVQIALYVGPEQVEAGLPQKLCPVLGIGSTSWATLSASLGEEAPSLSETRSAREGGDSYSEEKGRGLGKGSWEGKAGSWT